MILRILTLVTVVWFASCSQPMPIEVIPPPITEAVIAMKTLPRGWVLHREPIANWGTSLPQSLGVIPDTVINVEYGETNHTTSSGVRLPVKRATIVFEYTTRITIERIELQFVNVDYVYSMTSHESSHYLLEGVIKSIELKPTGFPQLKAEDIIKYKILMVYGTPQEFDGTWYRYRDNKTEMKAREVDERHMIVSLRSLEIERKFQQAIEDVYSAEGVEFKKQQLLEGFEL